MAKETLKPYPIRVEETLFEKFKFVAKVNHRSISGHLAFLMEQAVKTYEAENGEISVDIDALSEWALSSMC